MPRAKGKPTKIAYAILGKPANIAFDKSPHSAEVEKRLTFEQTSKVR